MNYKITYNFFAGKYCAYVMNEKNVIVYGPVDTSKYKIELCAGYNKDGNLVNCVRVTSRNDFTAQSKVYELS